MRLRWLSVVAGLGLGLSSCSFDDGGVQPDGSDSVDASVDAEPPVCVPGCEGDILVTCPAGGAQRVECDLGCVADNAPHCGVMVPSNGVTVADLVIVPADKPFVVPAGAVYTIDTDSGRIVDEDNRQIRTATTGGALHEPTGTFYARRGEAIGFFAVDALTVENGATLRGDGERALIILSRGDITVRGVIDVSAGCIDGVGAGNTCGGPGGGEGATLTSAAGGCAPGGNGVGAGGAGSAGSESGAGGGGLGASGGAGGDAGETPVRPGGAAGTPTGACPGQTLVPLAGGSGGGAGGVGDINGGIGGGGGGAIQLSSLTRVLVDAGEGASTAAVRASGAGGLGTVAGAQGGGGGGSGGGILLEAPTIALAEDSVIAANGGGGGSGTVASSNAAANGAAGGLSITRAAGGIGDPDEDNRGFGGLGGARSGSAGGGGGTLDGGGGGGGGVGIIRINRRTQTFGTNVVVSPQHNEGPLTVQ